MLRPAAPFAVLLILVATVGPPGVLSEEFVGCLFSERLCLEDEWCFDDYAFGRCVQSNEEINEDDLYRYNLEKEVLHQISRELRRLFALGYRWSHSYTQCRLQAMLYTTRHETPFDVNECSHLVDQDLEGALKALEGQDPIMDPREMAIVKYRPSDDNPHADFANEVYYPPVEAPRQDLREKILPSNAIDILDMEDPYAQYEVLKRTWIPQMHRRALPQPSDDDLEYLPREEITPDDLKEMYPLIKTLNRMKLPLEQIQGMLPREDFAKLQAILEQFNQYYRIEEDDLEDLNNPSERFTLGYNTPDGFRSGWESRDTLPEGEDIPESRIYFDEGNEEPEQEEYGSGENFHDQFQANTEDDFRKNNAIFTEGGVVYGPESDPDLISISRKNLDQILTKYNLGFKRRERLDVKKPGPRFEAQQVTTGDKRAVPMSHKKYKDSMLAVANEKEGNTPQDPPYTVDPDYVFVEFKNNVYSWPEGNQIIANISHLLRLEDTAFTHGRIDLNEVSFKVEPNSRGLNASQVVQKIGELQDTLKETTGIEITAAGIGDKTKIRAFMAPSLHNNEFYVVMLLVCGVLAAMIIAAALLLIIKRHLKAREKLQGLARPDTEASKDYQDLCRARMAAKGQPPSGDTVHGRITSLSRESEQSPSSRSSTSSWSEEPALHNMDISTGHMVLTYMEDHLKNKDRLEQEWVALCAYVAEPCETTIALHKDNVGKNRYPDITPYDHSRVVLNDLSNISGSDYINASSITDHDPRNPAYISTQGPLPHTAPDFWQLIWEQGAVVIVMLTRLTESGAAMCHRYWPEEGSEVYHIYEVHLVSEHIWCDDYLVRSFYLKNIRTGETRTVTQFHFLSWPETGVPASTKALLEFRRKVNKSYRGRSCPIVIHCSDGAGRAGTYCLIDMVLSRMAKGAKEIDIAATLEHLRDQRPKMVASKQQFEFVLTAVAEEVHAILKALPPQPSPPQSQEK